MKRLIPIMSILGVTTCFVFGFTTRALRPNPPKRTLIEAYALAVQAMGPATNQFYCVASEIDRRWCPVGAWVFTFEEIPLKHRLVFVAMEPFERSVWRDDHTPWPLTEIREIDYLKQTTNNVLDK